MDEILLEALLEDAFPRIELRGGRFLLHRSETETLEINSPTFPIFIAETLDSLPDDDARIDFLHAMLRFAGSSENKLAALIDDIESRSGEGELL